MTTINPRLFLAKLYEKNTESLLRALKQDKCDTATFVTVSNQIGRMLAQSNCIHVTLGREQSRRRYYHREALVRALQGLCLVPEALMRIDDRAVIVTREAFLNYGKSYTKGQIYLGEDFMEHINF